MRSRRFFLLVCTISAVLTGPLIGTSARAAVVPKEGIWQGQDTDGKPIEFSVRNNGQKLTLRSVDLVYDCPGTGATDFGYGFAGYVATTANGTFHWRFHTDKKGKAADPRATDAGRVEGTFDTTTTASGTRAFWMTRFNGQDFDIMVCSSGTDGWTANWARPLSKGDDGVQAALDAAAAKAGPTLVQFPGRKRSGRTATARIGAGNE